MNKKSSLEDTVVKLYEPNLNYRKRMLINGEIQNFNNFFYFFILYKDTSLA